MNTDFKIDCPTCCGAGWYPDHADEHGEDGECINCPIQRQCFECKGTGKVVLGYIIDLHNNEIIDRVRDLFDRCRARSIKVELEDVISTIKDESEDFEPQF